MSVLQTLNKIYCRKSNKEISTKLNLKVLMFGNNSFQDFKSAPFHKNTKPKSILQFTEPLQVQPYSVTGTVNTLHSV